MSIFLMADIHGRFQPVEDFYERIKDNLYYQGDHTLIMLGDTGLNYYLDKRDQKLKERLSKYPFTYFVIRGNHEERPSICAEKAPNAWYKERYFGNDVWVEYRFPNIKYAMDDINIYNIDGHTTLVVPGAYSVDKWYRLKHGYNWFPHEQLSPMELERGMHLILGMNKYDLILSHTCPRKLQPRHLFLQGIDQSMVEEDMEIFLDSVLNKVKFKVFLWGHYHDFLQYDRDEGIPSYENPRIMMLYNEGAVNLNEVMYSSDINIEQK